MKRILAISLIAIHLLFTTGVKVDMHFCGDSLKDFSISKISAEIEPCCKMDKTTSSKHASCNKSSCCESTSATLLSLNSFKVEQSKVVSTPLLITEFSLSDDSFENGLFNLPTQNISPPILQGRAMYLTTSSFCFYG